MAKRPTNLRLVAVIQRQLLWLVLGLLLLNVGRVMVQQPALELPIALAALGLQLAAIVQVCRLALALGSGVVMVVVLAFFMILPLINLIVMLLENNRATGKLKAAGLRVGLMGVNPEQLHKLEQGCCGGCGYDLTGLDGTRCPECGLEKPLAVG